MYLLKATHTCTQLWGSGRDKLIHLWKKKKWLCAEKHYMHQQVWFLDFGFEKSCDRASLQISKYWWSAFHSFDQKKWTKCCGILLSEGDLFQTTNYLLSGYCWSALDYLKNLILLQPFWVTRSLQDEVKNKFYQVIPMQPAHIPRHPSAHTHGVSPNLFCHRYLCSWPWAHRSMRKTLSGSKTQEWLSSVGRSHLWKMICQTIIAAIAQENIETNQKPKKPQKHLNRMNMKEKK